MPGVCLTNVEVDIIAELQRLDASSPCRYITYATMEDILARKYGLVLNRATFLHVYAKPVEHFFTHRLTLPRETSLSQINRACNHFEPVGLVGLFIEIFRWNDFLWFTHLSDMIMFKLLLLPDPAETIR